MTAVYRIQSDYPNIEGSTATVFFADAQGGIVFPGWTVAIATTDTVAEVITRAENARDAA